MFPEQLSGVPNYLIASFSWLSSVLFRLAIGSTRKQLP